MIDMDFDSANRYKVIDWVIKRWGRENVAKIGTIGSLGLKSLARRYYKVTEGNQDDLTDFLKLIPEAHYGTEANLDEMINGNEKKDYKPVEQIHEPRFADLVKTIKVLEGLPFQQGIHAAGVIISDEPIWNRVPVRLKKEEIQDEVGNKKEVDQWVTEYDMHEVEELGNIKYDFLGIDNLTIIKYAIALLKEKGIEIDPYKIPDEDPATYALLTSGYLAGLFQVETSGIAQKLLNKNQPKNIPEISDNISIGRPGPLQAGLDEIYYENKSNGYAPDDKPEQLQEILKDSHYTILYQEQLMKIFHELGGYSLEEADTIRRALGF